MTSFHRAPSWVRNSAVPFTESRVDPLSHAVNENEPEIGATLLEYGPFRTCDSSPSRSSPNARRIGAARSGGGKGPGRSWKNGATPFPPEPSPAAGRGRVARRGLLVRGHFLPTGDRRAFVHAELLVGARADGAVDFIATARKCHGECVGRAGLDRLDLLLNAPAFDFDGMRNLAAVGHDECHGARGDSRL